MQKSRDDVWVGLFVVIGCAAILFLAVNVIANGWLSKGWRADNSCRLKNCSA